jgi:glucose/arabinose dehydrogenase
VTFNEPLDIVQEPTGLSDAWIVVEKAGRVLRLENSINGLSNTFFTKTGLYLPAGGETGMAGFAFDPQYASNRYVYYTYSTSTKLRLARATASLDGRTANVTNERVLLDFDYTSIMHRSGDLKFGPGPNGETYLYMSTGDGGHWDINQDNQRWKANDNNQPNGKILRLSPAQYRGNATLAWSSTMMVAKGLRNPWRMNFNGNDLYIAVVSGDPGIEELNRLNVLTQVGTHFGWPFGEGMEYCTGPNATTCANLGFPGIAAMTGPVMQYSRTENGTNGAAIIGGLFYTGAGFLANQGKYVYADYTLQQLRMWDPANGQRSFLIAAAGAIADIGVDRAGELMIVQHNGPGSIYKVVPGTGGNPNWPPQNLADWGCFDNLNNGYPVPAEGVRYFDVAQRFWSDGAHKERFVAIPAGSKIDVSNTEDWKLPNGGVTIKNFYMNNAIFESRFFVRHNNGAYAGYTYRWDTPNSATLVPSEGGTKDLGNMVWEYPSRAQCMLCHTTPVNGNVALETRQMNVDGQVQKFTLLNMLNPAAPTLVPKFPDPMDVSVALGERAESYMHVNCATCHRGVGNSVAGRGSKNLCNKLPFEAVSGNAEERLVKAGDHNLSTVWLRAHQRTAMYMPPLGSKIPDVDGVNVLKDWITGLTTSTCPE